MVSSVVDAVQRDLDALGERVAESAEAVLALALARRIDDGANSATSVSMNAGKLLDTMQRLRELAALSPAESPLDEIRARRDRKLERASGS